MFQIFGLVSLTLCPLLIILSVHTYEDSRVDLVSVDALMLQFRVVILVQGGGGVGGAHVPQDDRGAPQLGFVVA